jgi:hypothetical protein
VRPSAIIERLFKLTFGERHLSWKCIGRSCLATLSIFFAAWVTLILVAHPSALHWPSDGGTAFAIGLTVLTLGALPDYISLWMTRGLLNVLGRHDRLVATLVVVSLDACLSLLASVLIVSFVSSKGAEDTVGEEAIRLLHALIHPGDRDALSAFPLSTLFTSIWTILILLSTTALKFLAPVHRFTSWFFDVDKHPVQAIGIVSGGLVIIGSMIWTVLRAIL